MNIKASVVCRTAKDFIGKYIVACLLKARIVKPAEQPLLRNGSVNTPLLGNGSVAVT
jgi:hypothetical protein